MRMNRILFADGLPDSIDLNTWNANKNIECDRYWKSHKEALALTEPRRSLVLDAARVKWTSFWNSWPGCGRGDHCTAQTPCGQGDCTFKPLQPTIWSNRSSSSVTKSASSQITAAASAANGSVPRPAVVRTFSPPNLTQSSNGSYSSKYAPSQAKALDTSGATVASAVKPPLGPALAGTTSVAGPQTNDDVPTQLPCAASQPNPSQQFGTWRWWQRANGTLHGQRSPMVTGGVGFLFAQIAILVLFACVLRF